MDWWIKGDLFSELEKKFYIAWKEKEGLISDLKERIGKNNFTRLDLLGYIKTHGPSWELSSQGRRLFSYKFSFLQVIKRKVLSFFRR